MDIYEGRRGKRRVKIARNRSSRARTPTAADLLKSFVPITLLSSLTEMTCTMQNTSSCHDNTSSCHDNTTETTSCSYARCSECPQAFCSEDALREHVTAEHAESDDGSVVLVEEKRRVTEPTFKCNTCSRPDNTCCCHNNTYKCCKCAYVAPDYNRATVHAKLHVDQASGTHVFRCGACQFLSCSKMGLAIHKRLEHAPLKYQCPMCNYASFNARHVTAHVDKIHCTAAKNTLECPYCPTKLEKGYHLKEHLQHEHIDESLFKEYTCNLCSYVSHTNTDIVTHTKAHISKKRLFRCTKCCFISLKFDKYAKHVNTNHGLLVEEEMEELETEELEDEEEELETEEVQCVSSSESGPTGRVSSSESGPTGRMSSSESGQQPNIPVIRVIQKREFSNSDVVDIDIIQKKEFNNTNVVDIDNIQKKEFNNTDVVDIDNILYTPPTSPHHKSDPTSPHLKSHPGNIFDKMNLKSLRQDKDKVIMAVGLRQSPRKKTRTVDYKPMKLKKLRLTSGHMALKSKTIKRCRYCTTKTMFDTVSKLREHHRKVHGITVTDLDWYRADYRGDPSHFQIRTYKCKYCTVKPEFDNIQELKEHYQKLHPQAAVRKLVRNRKPRNTNSSNESDSQEIPKVKPSLLDQIDMVEMACEPARQDMLDCILQSQKQIGQTLQDFNPDFDPTVTAKTRVNRQNSAPDVLFDRPPSVKPLIFQSDRPPFKNTNSAPSTPILPPPAYDQTNALPKTLPEIHIPSIPHLGTSIYNLSLVELQYLQQCYIYQAQCINLYNSDPIYRQYVHDRQRDMLLQSRRKDLEQALHEMRAPTQHEMRAPTQRPMVTVSDPRSLAPTAAVKQKLKLTKPKLGSSPKSCGVATTSQNECFATGCSFVTDRLSDWKRHVTEEHKIRITSAMMADLEKQIKSQETPPRQQAPRQQTSRLLAPAQAPVPPAPIPNVTINRTFKCTHCSVIASSFDLYVQHIMEEHRTELGIVSQGTQPNTFSSTYSPIHASTYSPTKSRSTAGSNKEFASPNKMLNLTSPSMLAPPTMLNTVLNLTSPSMLNLPLTSPSMLNLPSPATTASPAISAASPVTDVSTLSSPCLPTASPASYHAASLPTASPSAVSVSSPAGPAVFECTSCYYVGASAKALAQHERIHNGIAYQCPSCDYEATTQATLKIHMNLHKT